MSIIGSTRIKTLQEVRKLILAEVELAPDDDYAEGYQNALESLRNQIDDLISEETLKDTK